jgi:hypothetical protein
MAFPPEALSRQDLFYIGFRRNDRYQIRQSVLVLFTDGNIRARKINEFVVEGQHPADRYDITTMHPAEKIQGQDLFPLLQGDQHHRRSVHHDQTRVVFTGFDIKNMVMVYFQVPAVQADKEEWLHVASDFDYKKEMIPDRTLRR